MSRLGEGHMYSAYHMLCTPDLLAIEELPGSTPTHLGNGYWVSCCQRKSYFLKMGLIFPLFCRQMMLSVLQPLSCLVNWPRQFHWGFPSFLPRKWEVLWLPSCYTSMILAHLWPRFAWEQYNLSSAQGTLSLHNRLQISIALEWAEM